MGLTCDVRECWEEVTKRRRKLLTDELQISAWPSVRTGQCQCCCPSVDGNFSLL